MVRSVLFNLFLVLWELCYSLISLPILFLSRKVANILLTYATKVALSMLSLVCGIKYEIRGIEHIPKQPFIVASKHQSPFETFIFILLFKRASFVLKNELKWIPFVGLHLMALGMIFINRSDGISSIRRIIKSAKICLSENRSIVIFPEGTRTTITQRAKYQPGIAALYSALSVPVLPVALNTGLFWPKGLLSLNKRKGKAIIEILPPIYPGLSKQEFLQNLESVIEKRSNQLYW